MTNETRALYERGMKLIEIGRPAEARVELARALTLSPDDAWALSAAGWAARLCGDLVEAKRLIEAAIAADPDFEWPHRLRSVVLMQLGREEEALEEAREAVRLAPEETPPLIQLFSAQRRLKMLGPAMKTARRIIELAPEEVDGHIDLGLIQLDTGLFLEAEQTFRRALEIDPASDTALNNLGVALRRQGRNAEAIDAFHGAAKLAPNDALVVNNLKTTRRMYLSAGSFGGAAVIAIMLAPFSIGAAFAAIGFGVAAVVLLVIRFVRYRRLPKAVRDLVDDETLRKRRERLQVVLIIALFFLISWVLSGVILAVVDPSLFTAAGVLIAIALTALVVRALWRVRTVRSQG